MTTSSRYHEWIDSKACSPEPVDQGPELAAAGGVPKGVRPTFGVRAQALRRIDAIFTIEHDINGAARLRAGELVAAVAEVRVDLAGPLQ